MLINFATQGKHFTFMFCLCFSFFYLQIFHTKAQQNLTYFLPAGTTYDESISTPSEVIGFEVGEWHISPDRLVKYMEKLAAESDRVTIEEFGQTYEKRPQVLLTITSSRNQARIEELKAQHRSLTDPEKSKSLDLTNMPVVLYMGFSIHGNEPSGSNASLAVAYHLAAAGGEEIDKILDNTIILLDPSFNPDGLDRFASWVNSRRSITEVADPQNVEQNEPWPGGRTNHYWFDLNRDWLPAQLPESQNRLKKFHEWKPNVLTDHHEMGTNSTFFFQPGVPSRNNPLTPEKAFDLTARMGEYHARALDKIGSFYYTKESFDDYYYGKGSTYPDVQGAIGILFEQASSRGHAQESDHGILRFPFTIRNQFTTALSTIEAVNDMRLDFLNYQREFFQNSLKEGAADRDKAYVFGSSEDPARAFHLAELINRHDIDIYKLKNNVSSGGKSFTTDGSYVVPLDQPQYKLIKAMFETRVSFTDSLFYDISTWTLPYAFNLPFAPLGGIFNQNQLGEKFSPELPEGTFHQKDNAYAYLFEWDGYYAPKVLYSLLEKDIHTRVATKPFSNDGRNYGYGTIMVSASNQPVEKDELEDLLEKLAAENLIYIYSVAGGLDYDSYSLGSPTFTALEMPRVALLIGDGVSSGEAGEIWHLLDQRYKIPLTRLMVNDMNSYNLDKYNTIIMVSGSYSSLDSNAKEKLKSWITAGGTLVAQRTALNWLSSNGMGNFEFKKAESEQPEELRRYTDIQNYRGAQTTGGAIFNTKADLTHPILYGYNDPEIPVFRNHNTFLEKGKNAFSNPLMYTTTPLMSGYISSKNLSQLANSSALGISNLGRGRIIGFTDNHSFRAFWFGTNKMLLNSIFFGPVINRSAGR